MKLSLTNVINLIVWIGSLKETHRLVRKVMTEYKDVVVTNNVHEEKKCSITFPCDNTEECEGLTLSLDHYHELCDHEIGRLFCSTCGDCVARANEANRLAIGCEF